MPHGPSIPLEESQATVALVGFSGGVAANMGGLESSQQNSLSALASLQKGWTVEGGYFLLPFRPVRKSILPFRLATCFFFRCSLRCCVREDFVVNGLFNKHMSILHFLTSSNRLKIWKGEWQASKMAGRLRAVA